MSTSPRLFTLEEANAILPQVSEHVERIRDAAHDMVIRHPLGEDHEEAARALNSAGGSFVPSSFLADLLRFRAEATALDRLGVLLKDAKDGIVDFLHMRDGKIVFLCWCLGEEEITHYHEIGRGFADRQPLT
jgi:hypothetical protein